MQPAARFSFLEVSESSLTTDVLCFFEKPVSGCLSLVFMPHKAGTGYSVCPPQIVWHWKRRTQCLYNVDSVTPSPILPLSVLRFMLLFHVLSRICGICNTSKWRMVPICLNPVWSDSFRNEDYWKLVLDVSLLVSSPSLLLVYGGYLRFCVCWWSFGFNTNIQNFILVSLKRLLLQRLMWIRDVWDNASSTSTSALSLYSLTSLIWGFTFK